MAWLTPVRDNVYLALCAVFDCDPESNDSLKRFVPAYIESATNIQAPRNMDICYYALSEIKDSGFDYVQILHGNGVKDEQIIGIVPVRCLLTFYGTNADDDAEYFWKMFQWDNGYNSARAILRRNGIVPIGIPQRPLGLYETEGTFQRRRCDVELSLVYYEVTNKKTDYVEHPPSITLVNDIQNN